MGSGGLERDVVALKKSPVARLVERRLKEFGRNPDWFSELCFCISTANASSEAGLRFQEKSRGKLRNASERQLGEWLKESGCRFYNNKARFIAEARGKLDSKKLEKTVKGFENGFRARAGLVENVKGLGWKESSHFLRNVGFKNLAILDRHVLGVLKERGVILELKLSPKKYLEIEEKLEALCRKTGLNQAELDLFLWFSKTGKVLK